MGVNITSNDLRPAYFSATVTGNRFAKLNSFISADGIIALGVAISGSMPEGVVQTTMTATKTGKYISQYTGAIVELEVAGTVTAGDRLMPIAGGVAKKAVQYTTTIPIYASAVALEDCASGSVVTARLIQPEKIG